MTDIEQRLVRAGSAWRAEQPAAPSPALRRHPPRRWVPAVAAASVVLLAFGTAVISRSAGPEPAPPPADGSGSWQLMSPSPLTARLRPTMIGWRDQVVVVGGRIERPCPPNAGCVRGLRETQRDGALYDLRSDTWERLPDAPVPLDTTSSAVLDDVLYLWVSNGGPAVLALDLVARRWSTLPPPPVVSDSLRLVAAGDRLVAAYVEVGRVDAVDLAYDPSTRLWQPLPAAPFAPAYDRSMVWVGNRLVLVTAADVDTPGPPFMRAAVLEAGTWRALPPQETVIFGSTEWFWTGTHVVSATTYEADGGQTNGFGRPYPSGGFLDPTTGEWSELPETPAGHERETGAPYAATQQWVANGEGLVLDTRERRWIDLPLPPEAAEQDASAAWSAERLVVWGGAVGVSPAPGEPDDPEARLLATGAVWSPPSR